MNVLMPGRALRATIGAATVAALLVAPSAASARQSTLTLTQRGDAVAGQVATIVASGTNADPESGSYYLFIYAKDQRVDPTCAPTQEGESQTFFNNVFEPATAGAYDSLATGLLESYGPGSFNIEVKKAFSTAGPKLLCAYSTYIAETAAVTQMVVNVAPAAGTGAPPAGAVTPPAANAPPAAAPGGDTATGVKPAVTKKPRIARKGRRLSCSRGSWTNAAAYRYAWIVNGKARKGARGRALTVTRSVRNRIVRCRVTAYNAHGKRSATSNAVRVR